MFARANEVTPRVPTDVVHRTSAPGDTRPFLVPGDAAQNMQVVEERIPRLLADLGLRLAAVEAETIDETIDHCLSDLGRALQIDQILLWRRPDSDCRPARSHAWSLSQSSVDLSGLVSIPFIASRVESGCPAWFSRTDDILDWDDRDALRRQGLLSAIVIPILAGRPDGLRGGLALASTTTPKEWTAALVEQLRLLSAVLALAMARASIVRTIERAGDEPQRPRQGLRDGGGILRPTVKVLPTSRLIVSEGIAMQQALTQVEQVAPLPSTVLLLGETGVGKEVLAQAIHELSPRGQRQMIRVSCAAIPAALIESELFGRERGAYTGALSRQIGRFEAADQSTLFLDEIGDLPAETQVKLLRVLQDRVIERLGSAQPIKIDVRIVAATNRNLEQAVQDKTFREDLFYRLNVFPIVVPPLRERAEDIPALTWEFVNEFARTMGKSIESISAESMRDLQAYSWPGNVRELRNLVERAVIIARGPQLTIPMPPCGASRQPTAAMTLRNVETEHIRATLRNTNWRIRGRGGAAERLGLKPTTLETRMAKLGLIRPRES